MGIFGRINIKFAVLASAIILIAGTVNADLMLRQPSLKLTLNKGEVFQGGIVLENVSDKPLSVKAGLADAFDKDGKPASRSCAKWMSLEDESFVIPAGGIKDLRFRIAVPQDVEGGYYSSIMYSYDKGQVQGPEDITLNIKMHIEMPVNIQISGTVKNDISVKELKGECSKDGKIKIVSKVVNTGNSFTDVKATFLVMGPGTSVSKVFSSSNIKMYPGDEKEISYDGTAKPGHRAGAIIGVFDFGGEDPKYVQKKLAVK